MYAIESGGMLPQTVYYSRLCFMNQEENDDSAISRWYMGGI